MSDQMLTYEESMSLIADLKGRIMELEAQINHPETIDFQKAIVLEAAHQRERWGEEHDLKKVDGDWYWNLGYLASKIMHREVYDHEKVNHWIITCAAMCANWHYYRNKEEASGA